MARHGFLLAAGAALFTAGLFACSDSSSPESASDELTAAQADSLAEVITQDADELVAASEFSSTSAVILRHHVRIIPHFFPGPPPCDPAISPDPLSNSDSDAIPDSARFDFTGCSFTRGPFDVSVGGTIDLIDPSPTVPEFAIRLVFNDFGRTWTNTQTNRTRSVIHNGTRQISANADELNHSISNFLTEYTFASGATATHVRNWTGHFDAEVPGSIALDAPLPSGDWSFAGSSTWTKGARTWGVQTTTTTALHYDPACSVAPRFTSGQLMLTVTRNGHIVNVTIDFTGCGQYTVTRTIPTA